MSEFILIGHDNPHGTYPAPVVPVCRIDGRIGVVYESDEDCVFQDIDKDVSEFVLHDFELSKKLINFDCKGDRLFAYSNSYVDFYAKALERDFFEEFLTGEKAKSTQPFLRLMMAQSAGVSYLISRELEACAGVLGKIDPNEAMVWYARQLISLTDSVGAEMQSGSFPKKGHILIAEDQIDLAGLLRDTFVCRGIEVSLAYNGQAAYEKLVAEKPDVLILDLGMKGLDGMSILAKINTNPAIKGVEVVILSAWDANTYASEVIQLGARRFISKAEPSVTLWEEVDEALEKRHAKAARANVAHT